MEWPRGREAEAHRTAALLRIGEPATRRIATARQPAELERKAAVGVDVAPALTERAIKVLERGGWAEVRAGGVAEVEPPAWRGWVEAGGDVDAIPTAAREQADQNRDRAHSTDVRCLPSKTAPAPMCHPRRPTNRGFQRRFRRLDGAEQVATPPAEHHTFLSADRSSLTIQSRGTAASPPRRPHPESQS